MKKKEYENAEQMYLQAIHIYGLMKFEPGVALTKLNLAKCLSANGENEKAEIHYLAAAHFYRENNKQAKLFTANNFGIKLMDEMRSKDKIEKMVVENKEILKETNINSFHKRTFQTLLEKLDL